MGRSRFKLDFSQGLKSSLSFEGAPVLKQFLERYCFGEVRIQQWLGKGEGIGLVIHVDCPITLGDLLHHFQLGTWGYSSVEKKEDAAFRELMEVQDYLETLNEYEIDIEEFNIQLKDTLLIFQKTDPRSISMNWKALFNELSQHYRDFSQGGVRIPEEIYFNVIMEDYGAAVMEQNGLSSHWALYFQDDSRSWIYDLQRRSLTIEDLYVLSDYMPWDSQQDH